MSPIRTVLMTALVALGGLAAGCKQPLHLQYDYGRAFVETLRVQADLTRPSVQYQTYSLYGIEAVKIRLNVSQSTADAENATPDFEGVSGKDN